MRLTTACPVDGCNEKNIIEIDTTVEEQVDSKIPRPIGSRSGVVQFSISHPNHTLILDIDNNGTIRKHLAIPKIDTIVDHYISTVANQIKQHYNKLHTLLIVSEDPLWLDFYTKVAGVLLSDFKGEAFTSKILKKQLAFNFDKFSVIISKNANLLTDLNTNVSLIIDQKFLKETQIMSTIKQNLSILDIIGISLDYQHLLSETNEPLENVDILITELQIASAFYMVPDLESVGLFSLEILDNLPF